MNCVLYHKIPYYIGITFEVLSVYVIWVFITGPFSPVVPPFAARISHVVADVEAPGGERWERLNAGESNGKLPLRNLPRMQHTRAIQVA